MVARRRIIPYPVRKAASEVDGHCVQDCLIRPAPVFHSLNPLVQAGMRDVSEIFQNQIQVLNRAGLQPLRDIRTGADLTGSAAVMQAVPAIHILRLVAEAAEDHHPAAALLEARDAHHHMLQTSSRGILSEISCHGTLLLSKQKSGSCLCCTVCADAAPAFSDVTYQFVAPVLVPAPVCPPDLGQCIRSLSLRSAWL